MSKIQVDQQSQSNGKIAEGIEKVYENQVNQQIKSCQHDNGRRGRRVGIEKMN